MTIRGNRLLIPAALAVCLASPAQIRADRFSRGGEVTSGSTWDRAQAFFSNLFLGGVDANDDGTISEDESLTAGAFRSAVLAAMLSGISCGLLGSFVTLRRMALFGDMIGHSVLPGVVAGFVVGFVLVGEKSLPFLLGGALVAGLLAALFTAGIRRWSRVKEDAALGISLSMFYALGMWLLAWVVRNPRLSVAATGLESYLFGDPAVIQGGDLLALVVVTALVGAFVAGGFKELVLSSFDPSFGVSIGYPIRAVHWTLLVLLTCAIVVSVKILGVVLVAALLTIPPATAYLLADRMGPMAIVASSLGCVAGFAGNLSSAVLPVGTGPAIVCIAFALLLVAFLLAPRQGVLARWWRHWTVARRTARENILGAAYRVMESDGAPAEAVPVARIAEVRHEAPEATRSLARTLRWSGLGHLEGGVLVLSPEGQVEARRVVRNHRLWEVFLSQEASLPPDHLHDAAEEIEHFLPGEVVEELLALLEHPEKSPDGKAIPPIGSSHGTGHSGKDRSNEKGRGGLEE